jgi:hypothetical protein
MKKIFLILSSFVFLLICLAFIYFIIILKDESQVAEVIETKPEIFINKEKDLNLNLQKEKSETEKIENKNLESKVISFGNFIKIDALHYASGDVTVESIGENYKIKLAQNFSSAKGPDLFVYLSEPQNFKNIAIGGLNTAKTLNLGLLKNLKGEQEYLVSKADFEKYNGAVVIWCKQFGVQFSRADLK